MALVETGRALHTTCTGVESTVRIRIRRLSLAVMAAVGVFVAGGTAVHTIVMAIDFLSYRYLVPLESHQHFLHGLWSPVMLPMMSAYGILSVALYSTWRRARRLRARAHEQEIRLVEQRTRVDTAQKLTGLVMERVARENAAIAAWIQDAQRRGRTLPPRLVEASHSIGRALLALSRLSFEVPYRRGGEGGTSSSDSIEAAYEELAGEDV